MATTNIQFENEIRKLNEFYKFKNPKNVSEFIKQNEKLIDLLNESKIHLIETFPQGIFELEMYYDLSGEKLNHLLLNIYVDAETFNNGFMDKIHYVDMKILPMQKKLNLTLALNLMPRLKHA